MPDRPNPARNQALTREARLDEQHLLALDDDGTGGGTLRLTNVFARGYHHRHEAAALRFA